MKLLILLLLVLNIQAKTLEVYFDTPELQLLKSNESLKYQATKYLSNKNKPKYHENIIYTYDTNQTKIFQVKHYNSVKSIEEKHALLALVKRDERKLFIETLKHHGLKYPLKLKYILQTTDSFLSYKQLFDQQTTQDKLFSIKFQHPYIVNLFYAIITASIGILLIYILFRRRLASL